MADDSLLFEDTFTITSLNDEKYDRVARIFGTSADSQTSFNLDINTDLYKVALHDGIHVAMASKINDEDDPSKAWRAATQGPSMMDMYEYVCLGTLYRFEEVNESSENTSRSARAYISFGGMLMMLEAPEVKLRKFKVQNVYLLLKKE